MSNSTVIGTTSNFYGVATFQSQPIITSTILANNDNSTNIATTAWANSFLTYAQTQPNTWTGAQTFTTANVSVLNVFKTSVDTINASSITSDMTIGANLNGGSLTLGGVNSVTNITSGTINASNFKLYSGVIDGKQSIWLDTIQSNLTPNMHIGFNNASQIFIGSSKTHTIGIGGDAGIVNIANSGLLAGSRVNIGSGANATGSQVNIGSDSLPENIIKGKSVLINSQTGWDTSIGADGGGTTNIRGTTNIGTSGKITTLKGNTIVDGSTINSGTNIFCIKQNTGDFSINITDFLEDPFDITSPSGSTSANVTLGMGIDTTRNVGYINCAMSGYFRPLVLGPRNGNIYIGYLPAGFDNIANSYTNNTYGNLVVSGNIYCGSPIIPKYSYPIGAGKIGEIVSGTIYTGNIGNVATAARALVSSSGVWEFSWNIQFVLINATFIRPEFHIYGIISFNIQVASMPGQSSYYMMSGSYTAHVDSGPNGHGTIYVNYVSSSGHFYQDGYGNLRAVRIA